MGPNELNHLRRQAEREISSVNASWNNEVRAAVGQARATMYLAEVIRDGIGELSAILGEPTVETHFALTPPICTDGDCPDSQYHAGHDGEAPDSYEMGKELSRQRVINAEMLAALEAVTHLWDTVEDDGRPAGMTQALAAIAKAKGGPETALAGQIPKQETRSYDCFSGTNCGRDYCVAHGGHGADS